jgi:16S rRNA (guanine527-N7)-methyltransferase
MTDPPAVSRLPAPPPPSPLPAPPAPSPLPAPPALSLLSAPPALAAAVFGESLPLAVRYGERLAGDAVERGLIGPHEADRLWERHLLNCVAVAALIAPRSSVVDIGSGAGLPGIVLAIARPDLRVMLVEPMLRRTAFLESVVTDLGLTNVEVRRLRAEDLAKDRLAVDAVTARAVARLDRLASLAAPLLGAGGVLLAIKGVGVGAELTSGWPGIRRASMTHGAALFSIDGASAGTNTEGWLPAVDVTRVRQWGVGGVELGAPARTPAADPGTGVAAENSPTHAEPLALIFRLGRGR